MMNMIFVGERNRQLFQDIVKFGPFGGEFVQAEILGQGLQIHVVLEDLVPDLAGLLQIARTDRQIPLQHARFTIAQQQEGTVHAETLAGGNGGQGHRKHLLQINRALQDRPQFMQEADFQGFVVEKADQGLDLGLSGGGIR